MFRKVSYSDIFLHGKFPSCDDFGKDNLLETLAKVTFLCHLNCCTVFFFFLNLCVLKYCLCPITPTPAQLQGTSLETTETIEVTEHSG